MLEKFVYLFVLAIIGLISGLIMYRNRNDVVNPSNGLYLAIFVYHVLIGFAVLIFREDMDSLPLNFWLVSVSLSSSALLTGSTIYLVGFIALLIGSLVYRNFTFKGLGVSERKIRNIKFFLVFISLISTLVTLFYIFNVGGLVQAIVKADLYRAHGEESSPVGQFGKFQPLIITSSLLYAALNGRFRLFFIVIAMVYILISSSRTNFAFYLVSLYVLYLSGRESLRYRHFIFPSIFVLILINFGNAVTDYIYMGEFTLAQMDRFYYLISQLSPYVSNVLNADNFYSKSNNNLFLEILTMIPSSWTGLEIKKSWIELTEKYLGGFYTVGIPIDIFTYGYSQGKLFGVFLFCLASGIYLAFFTAFYRTLELEKWPYKFRIMVGFLLAQYSISYIAWASLDSAPVYGNMKYWFVFLIMFLMAKGKNFKL